MQKIRLSALLVLLLGFGLGYFVFTSEAAPRSAFGKFPFRLGLDLAGGTHLVYRADVSGVPQAEVGGSMDALRDVIERRVNLFGVSEPVVQVEETLGVLSEERENRLIVELPGVTDVDEAVALIGRTPFLEFRLEREDSTEKEEAVAAIQEAIAAQERGEEIDPAALPDDDRLYAPTELTGRFLKRSTLGFESVSGESQVLLAFTSEGEELFAEITRENVGRTLAIYLDGAPISVPVIREEIKSGGAVISGNFTPEEARTLVGRLNSGALPVPIELLSTQTIGASLGKDARENGVRAGMWGLAAVALFMVFWYRLPGAVAVLALGIYIAAMLSLFKLVPVTLTAAGIAGFILSLGMAVDANILIFERLKEELRSGKPVREAAEEGFKRAWLAIRDSNLSSIITAIILFWFGTSLVEGFALVFGFGILISMLTAISVTKMLLLALSAEKAGHIFLFGSGITRPESANASE